MNRTPCVLLISLSALLAVPAGALAETGSATSQPPPAAETPSQPVATVPEVVTLLCTGTYYDPNIQDPVTRQRATQFTIKLSYAGSYMELKANEWPALQAVKENPSVVRTAKFIYDDSTVKAQFVSRGDDVRGALFSIGLAGVAGDKDTITLDRKTGNFSYPNTSGHCEKVETQEKENKF